MWLHSQETLRSLHGPKMKRGSKNTKNKRPFLTTSEESSGVSLRCEVCSLPWAVQGLCPWVLLKWEPAWAGSGPVSKQPSEIMSWEHVKLCHKSLFAKFGSLKILSQNLIFLFPHLYSFIPKYLDKSMNEYTLSRLYSNETEWRTTI